MDILNWAGLALIVVALVLMVTAALKGSAKLNRAATLMNIAGLVALVIHDGRNGEYGIMTCFLAFIAINVASFFWSRGTERKKATA